MVSTDLAGRGLDIEGLNTIINFDFPNKFEKFVHRCGRTGRAFKQGKVITFISSED